MLVRFLRAFLLVTTAVAASSGAAVAAQWGKNYFPDVPLVTQDGETVRFYDDLVDGKIVVFNFIYTDCPDICSLTTSRLAQIYEWLSDRVGKDIFFYSISLDPATDTPEKLKTYADSFGVSKGWLFLTGEPDDVALVRSKLGERSASLTGHRNDMVLGNGSVGEWRRASLMGSLQTAAVEILRMDPDWTPPASEPDATEIPEGGFDPTGRVGEALFLQGCASCHTIGDGVRLAPDLAGVTLRRDRDWLLRYLMDPDGLRKAGDPTATALDVAFPGIVMPNLGLGETDVGDVLAYVQSEMDRIDAETLAAQPAAEEAEAAGDAGHHGQSHASGPDATDAEVP